MSPRKSVFVRCLLFFDRIAGKAAAQFLEDLTVYLREHDGGMNLTIAQSWQLFQSFSTIVVMGREQPLTPRRYADEDSYRPDILSSSSELVRSDSVESI